MCVEWPAFVSLRSSLLVLAFLTRLPAVAGIGGEILGEQRWEVPTAQIAESEILRPVDDTRILCDDATVEFAGENQQVEILPGVEHTLLERVAVLVAQVRDDAVDLGHVVVLVALLVAPFLGFPDGLLGDAQSTVDPFGHLVDELVDHPGGNHHLVVGRTLGDDPGVEFLEDLLADLAVFEHRRQFRLYRGRHVTGDAILQARLRDVVEQVQTRLFECLVVIPYLLGDEKRGVQHEPLFQR
jgi:hypothetical protein